MRNPLMIMYILLTLWFFIVLIITSTTNNLSTTNNQHRPTFTPHHTKPIDGGYNINIPPPPPKLKVKMDGLRARVVVADATASPSSTPPTSSSFSVETTHPTSFPLTDAETQTEAEAETAPQVDPSFKHLTFGKYIGSGSFYCTGYISSNVDDNDNVEVKIIKLAVGSSSKRHSTRELESISTVRSRVHHYNDNVIKNTNAIVEVKSLPQIIKEITFDIRKLPVDRKYVDKRIGKYRCELNEHDCSKLPDVFYPNEAKDEAEAEDDHDHDINEISKWCSGEWFSDLSYLVNSRSPSSTSDKLVGNGVIEAYVEGVRYESQGIPNLRSSQSRSKYSSNSKHKKLGNRKVEVARALSGVREYMKLALTGLAVVHDVGGVSLNDLKPSNIRISYPTKKYPTCSRTTIRTNNTRTECNVSDNYEFENMKLTFTDWGSSRLFILDEVDYNAGFEKLNPVKSLVNISGSSNNDSEDHSVLPYQTAYHLSCTLEYCPPENLVKTVDYRYNNRPLNSNGKDADEYYGPSMSKVDIWEMGIILLNLVFSPCYAFDLENTTNPSLNPKHSHPKRGRSGQRAYEYIASQQVDMIGDEVMVGGFAFAEYFGTQGNERKEKESKSESGIESVEGKEGEHDTVEDGFKYSRKALEAFHARILQNSYYKPDQKCSLQNLHVSSHSNSNYDNNLDSDINSEVKGEKKKLGDEMYAALDLIRQMLRLDPADRICAVEGLRHRFFDELRG